VRDELLRIDEVAKVEIYGAQLERIFVEYNNARLAEFGLSPLQLKGILDAHNIIQSGGTITSDGEDIVLEPTGNFESVADLKRTLIQVPQNKEVVYLEDLANVYRGYVDPPTNKMNTTGVSCLGLSVSMIDGGNVIQLGEKVRTLVDRLPEIYKVQKENFQSRFYRLYRGALVTALKHRVFSLALIVGIFVLAVFGLGFVESGFIPKNDSARLLGELDLPLGTAIKVTESAVSKFEQYLKKNHMADEKGKEGFVGWTTYIGNKGGPRYRLPYEPKSKGSEHVSMILSATSRDFIVKTIPLLERYCEAEFSSMTTTWEAESLGGVGGKPVQFRLSGKDIFTLFTLAEKVKDRLRKTSGTKNIEDDWGPRTKKIMVDIHQARARRAGVTSQDVAISLESGLSGFATTEYREGDDVIPIVLRGSRSERYRQIGGTSCIRPVHWRIGSVETNCRYASGVGIFQNSAPEPLPHGHCLL
jgi:multidrug efflux pump subunit AcrB